MSQMTTKNLRSLLGAAIVFVLAAMAAPLAGQTVRYVDIATGVDDGTHGAQVSPWQTVAYALSQVTGSSGSPYEIRVAQGRIPDRSR